MTRLDWKWLNLQPERGVFSFLETFSTIGVFIQPMCTISLEDTSTKILNTVYPRNIPDNEFQAHEHEHLGLLIYAIARQIPAGHAAQAKLVQLVIALSEGVTNTDLSQKWHSSGFECHALDQIACTTEPVRNPADNNVPAFFSADARSQTNVTFTADMSGHLYMNAFVAMLQKQNFFSGVFKAIWKLRDALEMDFENPGDGLSDLAQVLKSRQSLAMDAISTQNLNIAMQNGLIQAGGIWMALNAKQIHEEVAKNPNRVPLEGPGAKMLRTGAKYNGPLLGSQRWDFWK